MVRKLIEHLRADGFSILVENGNLVVSPWSRLPGTAREELRVRKPAVVAFLLSEPPEGGVLLDGGRRWVPPPARPDYCPCDQARVWDSRSGLCRTCRAAVFGGKVTARGSGGSR